MGKRAKYCRWIFTSTTFVPKLLLALRITSTTITGWPLLSAPPINTFRAQFLPVAKAYPPVQDTVQDEAARAVPGGTDRKRNPYREADRDANPRARVVYLVEASL